MPKFVTFFSYTGESAKAMINKPTDRSAAARTIVESLGGSMESFYWMQGKHDGLFIYTVKDSISASAISLAVGSTGAITGLETHQIYDRDEQMTIVETAKKVTYKPPTA
jgi:uncharacterized protein with GYD domain